MPQTLKPCPFCGEKAQLTGDEGLGFYIECAECFCAVGQAYDRSGMPEHAFQSAAEAAAAWNQRVTKG
ncbi:MAG: Lar family restriction alleviation protein [Pseudomonas sp.]|uniref:Lar family restriction alleviation protein n=1 Tax=Pseudomonas sp. TaxID=306 RepID=UPI00339B735E